jgi:hypothetical protein
MTKTLITKTLPKIERTSDGLFVVRLPQVPVNWDQSLDEAIRLGAPNTPSGYPIWQAASQYFKPAGKRGIELTDISLLGFDRSWESQEAIHYAAKKNLPTAMPQQVFAIGAAFPRLNRSLGHSNLAAVSLQKCRFEEGWRLPFLWFCASERVAGTRSFDFKWLNDGWFAVLGEVS